jgi:hypothetical protein
MKQLTPEQAQYVTVSQFRWMVYAFLFCAGGFWKIVDGPTTWNELVGYSIFIGMGFLFAALSSAPFHALRWEPLEAQGIDSSPVLLWTMDVLDLFCFLIIWIGVLFLAEPWWMALMTFSVVVMFYRVRKVYLQNQQIFDKLGKSKDKPSEEPSEEPKTPPEEDKD